MLLAGDIGGTKTVLALYNEKSEPTAPLDEQRYPSGQYDSLSQIVEEFLKGRAEQVRRASFGVAGPVVEGKASLPNLPWVIEEAQLKQRFDLETIAQAVPVLPPEDLETVKKGNAVLQGNMAVIAPGTGLGEASHLGRPELPGSLLRRRTWGLCAHRWFSDRAPRISAGTLRSRELRAGLLGNGSAQHLCLYQGQGTGRRTGLAVRKAEERQGSKCSDHECCRRRTEVPDRYYDHRGFCRYPGSRGGKHGAPQHGHWRAVSGRWNPPAYSSVSKTIRLHGPFYQQRTSIPITEKCPGSGHPQCQGSTGGGCLLRPAGGGLSPAVLSGCGHRDCVVPPTNAPSLRECLNYI